MIQSSVVNREDSLRAMTAERSCIAHLSEHFEDVHIELVDEAKALVMECHDLIKADFKENKMRRPPLALSCKVRQNQLGPTLVWVRYPIIRGQNAAHLRRFATEVPGRRHNLYPVRIFKAFEDSQLIERLIEIEKRAGELRQRTTNWRAIQSALRQLDQAKRS